MNIGSKKNPLVYGFTLIELIMVIVILAIISSLAISKFADLKKKSAKRVNISTMQNLTRAVETYIVSADSQVGNFAKMESLLDVSASGSWKGTAGTYNWTLGKLSDIPGIYRGPKAVSQISNANGEGASTTEQTLDEQRVSNQGPTDSLWKKLGVYYLTDSDVAGLKNVGISNYLLHNYLAGQSSLFGFTQGEGGMVLENGGPGFRVDMTAFYPAVLTNGSPVCVLNPAACADTFKRLGCDLGFSYSNQQLINTASRSTDSYAALGTLADTFVSQSLATYRLFCFGLGRSCSFAQKCLDTVPRDEVYGREYYRNYILVFKQATGRQSGGVVEFAGVIDADGNSIEDARFQSDWR